MLDIDSIDDPTHGYDDQHQYLPLLIFDGDIDQLVTAVLRSGNVHARHEVVPVLTRVVRALRARWPEVAIEVRLGSGGAVPSPLLAEAQAQAADSGAPIRIMGEARFRAGSWTIARRMVF